MLELERQRRVDDFSAVDEPSSMFEGIRWERKGSRIAARTAEIHGILAGEICPNDARIAEVTTLPTQVAVDAVDSGVEGCSS